jgi:hypothetical protein
VRPRPGYPLGVTMLVTMLVTVPMMSTAQKTAIATNAYPRRRRLSACCQLAGSAEPPRSRKGIAEIATHAET